MKVSILLFVFSLTEAVSGTLYFQPIGKLNLSPSYGHVHFVVDTHVIEKHLTNVEEAIAYIRKSVHTITHKSVEKRASNFLKRAHLDVREMINDLCEIITETNPDKSRTKRFLALLLAISSLSLSLFNSAELLH